MPKPDPLTILLETMVDSYLEKCMKPTPNKIPEMEVRFGNIQKCSRTDYEQVVQQLAHYGWITHSSKGTQMLRIYKDVRDETGKFVSSKLRTELKDVFFIQEYCHKNSLSKLKEHPSAKKCMKFTKKEPVLPMIKFEDFDFRIAFQTEEEHNITSTHPEVLEMLDELSWINSKKFFRNINRVRFEHPDYPIFVDLSIIKSNKTFKQRPQNTETFQEAGIFSQSIQVPIHFEIELELDNSRCVDMDKSSVLVHLRKCIRLILSGMQGTPFPISLKERNTVLESYMSCIFGENRKKEIPIFIGPMSVTLQMEHILQNNPILKNEEYSVTEKADGLRCLLYIAEDGRVYMITVNMKVIFTGAIIDHKECHQSILDGEFIMRGKHERILFLFAAFDIYFYGGLKKEAHVREHAFLNTKTELDPKKKYRYDLLIQFQNQFIESMKMVTKESKCPFRFQVKKFEKAMEGSIFQACERLWADKDNYEYEIDGLIFTPISTGVGSTEVGKAYDLNRKKFTWEHSFKWKPPFYNTIDFLVKVDQKKGVGHLFDEPDISNQIIKYQTLILCCGTNVKQSRSYLNDMITDNIIIETGQQVYLPKPFQPTTPSDSEAHICYLPLVEEGTLLRMKTEEGEYFEDNMIIEFRYDMNKTGSWRWIPLRIRHDKTEQLREGKRNFGNDSKTANSVWYSIHYPISEEMITGKTAPLQEINVVDAVYYHIKDKKHLQTNGLRNFHNLFVKEHLIKSVVKYLKSQLQIEISLIDYAVGKAGDLPKWKRSGIDTVFGIDLYKNNIYDEQDGACARYFRGRKKNDKPKALFVVGDSGKNIKESKEFDMEEKDIIQHIFGIGKSINVSSFPYGYVKDGFHISSCQFAIHYFFKNPSTFHGFLRNLSECTRVDGFFIGTCFDGDKVFEFLQKKRENERIVIHKNEVAICQIIKKYSSTINTFPKSYQSIGMEISVFLESMGDFHTEYLVSIDYLTMMLAKYGFEPIPEAILKVLDFNHSSDMFSSLYNIQKTVTMTEEEKQISFLNRYFIFQKKRNIPSRDLKQFETEAIEEWTRQEKVQETRIKLDGKKVELGSQYEPILD